MFKNYRYNGDITGFKIFILLLFFEFHLLTLGLLIKTFLGNLDYWFTFFGIITKLFCFPFFIIWILLTIPWICIRLIRMFKKGYMELDPIALDLIDRIPNDNTLIFLSIILYANIYLWK